MPWLLGTGLYNASAHDSVAAKRAIEKRSPPVSVRREDMQYWGARLRESSTTNIGLAEAMKDIRLGYSIDIHMFHFIFVLFCDTGLASAQPFPTASIYPSCPTSTARFSVASCKCALVFLIFVNYPIVAALQIAGFAISYVR